MKEIIAKQTAILENIDKSLKHDKLVQLTQTALQSKTDKDLNKDMGETVDALKDLRKVMEKGLISKKDGANSNIEKLYQEAKKQTKSLSKLTEKDKTAGILEKASGLKTYKTVGDRVKDKVAGFKDFFTLSGFADKTGLAKRGGDNMLSNILDRREAKQSFVKQQLQVTKGTWDSDKMSDKDRKFARAYRSKTAGKQFDDSQVLLKKNKANQAEIQSYKDNGWNDNQIQSAGLLKGQAETAKKLQATDKRLQQPTTKREEKAVFSDEAELETNRREEKQTELLQSVADNTKSLKPQDSGGSSDKSEAKGGGGILGEAASGLGRLGAAIAKIGGGIGKAFSSILKGIAQGFAALANPATLGGMAAFTLTAMGIGTALNLAAPAITAFAPVLEKLADVIQNVLVTGLKALPEILNSVGDNIVKIVSAISGAITGIIDAVVGSVERLAKIDGMNLLAVGAGLASIGAGFVALSAGQAVAGVGNLVGGFLNAVTGQKTPVEQLEDIAKLGPGLSQAGTGIEKISAGIGAVGPDNGAKVATMSKKVNNMKDDAASKQASAPVIVSAPSTNVSNKQNVSMPAPVRNDDSGFNRYTRKNTQML